MQAILRMLFRSLASSRLDKLQMAYDEAFIALEANPSSGLKREL